MEDEALDDGKGGGMKTRVERMRLRDLKLLELNARYMRHETFQRLVANIRRDGVLTSAPFAVRNGDTYLVLSGNHRVMAAIDAGVEEADVIVTDDPLTPQQRIAIQLSHNALVGEDDIATLKLLYDELDTVDWRVYSGLDDKMLELLGKVEVPSITETALEFRTVTFMFLPEEQSALIEALETAKAAGKADDILAARLAEYDPFVNALDVAGRAHDVKNVATQLMLILSVFRDHLTDLGEAWANEENDRKLRAWVPLATIIGTDEVPPAVGKLLQRAVQKMVDAGDLTDKNRWQALEYLAADYLAGE